MFSNSGSSSSSSTSSGRCCAVGSLDEMTWYGARLDGAHRIRRDGSSFERHQPCNNQNALHETTPLGWVLTARCEKLVTRLESHATRAHCLDPLLRQGEGILQFLPVPQRLSVTETRQSVSASPSTFERDGDSSVSFCQSLNV